MSDKRYRQDDDGLIDATRAMPIAAPGKMPASARLFPGAMLMRKARDANGVREGAESAVAAAASSSGSALPDDVRGRFEGALGADLSRVRVHTGAESAAAASAVGAKAYTVGNDIHFADGNYAPADPFGLHLLAHEVAHTQQQAGGAPHRQHKLELSSAGDAAEVDADRAADAMVAGARASIAVGGAGIQREESESGGSSASFTLGDRTTQYGVSKDGKTSSLQHTREFELVSLGPYPVCPEPPLFLSGGLSAKVTAAASTKEGEGGEVESNTLGGSLALEASGKLLMGAAKKGLGKVGLEGALTGSLAVPVSVTLTKDGQLKLPKEIVAPLTVEVTIGLVGEVGEGHKKIGGALTRNLSSLKAGTITINDSGVKFEHCSMDALAQAGKDLLWNTAETFLPGGALIQQHEEDLKNKEIFDRNTEEQNKEAEKMMHDGPDDQLTRDRTVFTVGGAARELDGHIEPRRRIKAAKDAADAAGAPFNGTHDPSWWQNGAYNTYNAGTVSRMNGNQLDAKFEACDGGNQLPQLGTQCEAAYRDAEKQFKAAQQQQFGKVVS